MSQDHNKTTTNTITTSTKVPLAILVSTVSLAIYGTLLYAKLANKIDSSLSIGQAQQWIDDAREKNPGVNWPRIPAKPDAAGVNRDVILTKRNSP